MAAGLPGRPTAPWSRLPASPTCCAAASPLEEIGDLRLGLPPGAPERRRQRSRPRRPAGDPLGVRLGPDPGQHPRLVRPRLRARRPSATTTLLRAAYREWPLFAALIDVAEMSLAKTHRALARRLPAPRWPSRHHRAHPRRAGPHLEQAVLSVLDQSTLLEHKNVPCAQRSNLRAPYVDALSGCSCGPSPSCTPLQTHPVRPPGRPRRGAGCCCSRSTARPPACRTPAEPRGPARRPTPAVFPDIGRPVGTSVPDARQIGEIHFIHRGWSPCQSFRGSPSRGSCSPMTAPSTMASSTRPGSAPTHAVALDPDIRVKQAGPDRRHHHPSRAAHPARPRGSRLRPPPAGRSGNPLHRPQQPTVPPPDRRRAPGRAS